MGFGEDEKSPHTASAIVAHSSLTLDLVASLWIWWPQSGSGGLALELVASLWIW